jgi:hypothetical protein
MWCLTSVSSWPLRENSQTRDDLEKIKKVALFVAEAPITLAGTSDPNNTHAFAANSPSICGVVFLES